MHREGVSGVGVPVIEVTLREWEAMSVEERRTTALRQLAFAVRAEYRPREPVFSLRVENALMMADAALEPHRGPSL